MVTRTLPAGDVEDTAYQIKKLIGLCQWIEQARKVVDTIHYVSTHTERGAEALGVFNIAPPDWDGPQSEGLDLLLSKIYAAAGDLEEDAMKAAADAEELSPDAFDALSPAGQLHHLAEMGLRRLPVGRRTDESRRCLNQMVAMLADELEEEREQAQQALAQSRHNTLQSHVERPRETLTAAGALLARRGCKADEYRGSWKQLVEAGVAAEGEKPGLPGNGVRFVTVAPDGRRLKRRAPRGNRMAPGTRAIWKVRKDLYCVEKFVSEAEEQRRRAEEESRRPEDRPRALHSHLQLAWSANR